MSAELLTRSEFSRIAMVSPAAVTQACATVLKAAVVGRRINRLHADAVEYLLGHGVGGPEPIAINVDPLYGQAVEHCFSIGKANVGMLRKQFGIGGGRAQGILDCMRAAGTVPEPRVVSTPPTPVPVAPVVETKPPPASAPPASPPEIRVVHVPAAPPARESVPVAVFDAEPEVPDDFKDIMDWTIQEVYEKFGSTTRFNDWLKARKDIEAIIAIQIKNAKAKGVLVSREVVHRGVFGPIEAAHLRLMTDGARTIAERVSSKAIAGDDLKDIEKWVSDHIASVIKPMKARIAKTMKGA